MNPVELETMRRRAFFFLQRLENRRWEEGGISLECEAAVSDEPVPWRDRMMLSYRKLHVGETWGRRWQSAWLHISGDIPDAWRQKDLALLLDVNGEAMLFDDNGVPVYSFCVSSCFGNNYKRTRLELPAPHPARLEMWVEATSSGIFGQEFICNDPPDTIRDYIEMEGKIRTLQLVEANADLQQLHYDMDVLFSLYQTLPERSYRRPQILRALMNAISVFGTDVSNASAARGELREQLSLPANGSALTAYAVGHSHIDIGWLWPVRETIRKCARTFGSQLTNLKRYPDYVFGASQAQNYAFVKENYPELYQQLREQVAAGRWEIQGGMWVEADCQLTSGESLVRQFLLGKNFFMDEFGIDVKTTWLPDTFGFSPSLVQIMNAAGCDVFITAKMWSNDTNVIPYTSFRWRGTDHSEVLAHILPERTYNSSMIPADLVMAQDNCGETDVLPAFLTLFGIGDGGAGAADIHLERALRCRNLEGMPKVKLGTSHEFTDRLRRVRNRLPVWEGELYLERHRGCLTSQARVKKLNRMAEQQLAAAEFMAACAGMETYPADHLQTLWREVLMNQFHDILPGSAIGETYATVEPAYQMVLEDCAAIQRDAAARLFVASPDSVVVMNTTGVRFTAPCRLPDAWNGHVVIDADKETAVLAQQDGDAMWILADVPPFGAVTLKKGSTNVSMITTDTARILENSLIRYVFDDNGCLCQIYDKELERDYLPPGQTANVFRLYVDQNFRFDAWELGPDYWKNPSETAVCQDFSTVKSGDVFATATATYKIGQSDIAVRMVLPANNRRMDFQCCVQWRERRRMLRVEFPCDVFANEASYDIQYGYLKRPLHTNTSWEQAKYEAFCQRFMDLSDAQHGVALLNDSKYGCRVHENILDLNLLRAPCYPDPNADKGEQIFTYALLPHPKPFPDAVEVFEQATMLNRAPLLFDAMGAHGNTCPFQWEGGSVVLGAVKKAEKGDEMVLRFYERSGREGRGTLRFLKPVAQVCRCDIMEWNRTPMAVQDNSVDIWLKPFELATVMVSFQAL